MSCSKYNMFQKNIYFFIIQRIIDGLTNIKLFFLKNIFIFYYINDLVYIVEYK